MTLPELLSRVEAATGPDRELDRDIWEAVTNECTHRETQFVYLENDERELECVNCGADTYGADKWSGLTASLDASLALIGRVLPGCKWSAGSYSFIDGHAGGEARIVLRNGFDSDADNEGCYETPTLALLAAMLKALITRQEETQ